MSTLEETLTLYHYTLPEELIASTPASPRDSARLLVYRRSDQSIAWDTFRNIGVYLPRDAVLVCNATKVFPARMQLQKSTGGKISALYLSEEEECLSVLATGTLREGEILTWKDGHTFTVVKREEKEATLKPSFPLEHLPSLLDAFGETPLPPYIRNCDLSETKRRTEYQTVFASDRGSIAAPTAGLHFTEDLLNQLRTQGITIEYVTLHVHRGTFAPLEEEQWKTQRLHEEYYSIAPDVAARLNTYKKEGRPIVAVGTTSVRTLESACGRNLPVGAKLATPLLNHLQGSTSLFMTEKYQPQYVDHLITNFHLPRTSLLMLVSAFTGREKLMEIYDRAIQERMRFYSFGDGMLIV